MSVNGQARALLKEKEESTAFDILYDGWGNSKVFCGYKTSIWRSILELL